MRTIYFPVEREAPETIKYLLDTVLMQNGSIAFDTANGAIDVIAMVNPNDAHWYADYTYIIRVLKRPDNLRHSRAKFVGITTTDLEEVKDFVLNYRETKEEDTRYHKKSAIKKVRHEQEERPFIDDWNE